MSTRTRNYASVIYPDSAPIDWMSKLEEQCIPSIISPLHDRDMDTEGHLKKPHYHVMTLYEGCKTTEQAKEVFDLIGGVGVEPIKSVKAYSRYLCHLDNPKKAQYNTADVIALSGADYASMINEDSSDRYTAIAEMVDFCTTTGMESFAQLMLYAKANRCDWFRVLCDGGSTPVIQFLKSYSWERRNLIERKNLL